MSKTILVVAVWSLPLCSPVFAGPQDAPQQSLVHRIESFLLDDERFEPSDKWTALFCKREDARQCLVATIAITESRSTKEQLINGLVVPALVYPFRPDDRLFMLVKGLKAQEGAIANVLGQRGPFAPEPQPIADEPVSLVLGSETYELRLDGLNLAVEERGVTSAQQIVPLFVDPDKRCDNTPNGDIRRSVKLVWMGDLDRDGRADFLIYASAYRSCARPILGEDPQLFLILSSRGRNGEIGQVIKPVGSH